jgi:hypothetical protein
MRVLRGQEAQVKRAIAVLLALALIAGAGFAQAGRGGAGGGRGGGSGGHVGSGGHPGMGGGGHFTGGPTHFTTGHTHFTTGPVHFTGGHPVHPIVHPPGVVGRPGFPHHRVIVSGAIVVGAPWYWWPPYPYPYYPYAYVPPGYGGPAYTEEPTYIEQQGQVYYYCPDYQDYYPNVPNCPSPWVQVVPGASGYPN